MTTVSAEQECCPICMNDIADDCLTTITFGCGHKFDSLCIIRWLNTIEEKRCPQCTQIVVEWHPPLWSSWSLVIWRSVEDATQLLLVLLGFCMFVYGICQRLPIDDIFLYKLIECYGVSPRIEVLFLSIWTYFFLRRVKALGGFN